jgi:circadian clock protein KaiC
LLKTIELSGERNRGLYILKSRGMSHSNQIREFNITPRGVELIDVYVGMEGVLTGSARTAQEARERSENRRKALELEQKRRKLTQIQALHREQLAKLQADFDSDVADLRIAIETAEQETDQRKRDSEEMARARRTGGNGEVSS